MKRKSLIFWGIFFVFFVVLARGFFVFFVQEKQSMPEGPWIHVGNKVFSIEIAKTQEEQGRGLGYRDELCDSCGMLFIFHRFDRYGFWMKGMRFPLDILWIRDGKVVHIEHDVDFRDQQRIYQSEETADRVLELNAGTCKKWNIQKGAIVSEGNI